MTDEESATGNGVAGESATEIVPAPLRTPPVPPGAARWDEWSFEIGIGVMQLAGLCAIGAGAIHAAAAGVHAEHVTLSRLFVAVAVAQLGVGLATLVRGGRIAAALTALVNLAAVAAWVTTRFVDVTRVAGLEQHEAARFADSVGAALGAGAVVTSLSALMRGRTRVTHVRLGLPAWTVGAFTVVAMVLGAGQLHNHADSHDHDAELTVVGQSTAAAVVGPATWPRPYDPTAPIDVSGVPGVTREQELRAAGLIRDTQEDLPAFADVSTLGAFGFQSIGDASTGFEHYINYDYLGDDRILDPTAPESLVYQVDGDQRTLVSAMYIANGVALDDPSIVDYGGPLMQWHVHANLCWVGGDDGPQVVSVTDDEGNCPPGSVLAGGDNPMVHVWIAPHECGPFAALEGQGAGQTADDANRVDQCASHHDHGDAVATESAPAASAVDASAGPFAYDPALPIDLSGTPGVTPQEQAFAENLIARTVVELPQWSDPAVAEAAGFHSIGDGATGHEHFIQWDWVDDDVVLDPDFPESLVYEPQPDGSRVLVAAMYMLPPDVTLDDVPGWGGDLMQWHIHDDLCFTADAVAPRVAGLTNPDGTCTAPLVKLIEAPMIHVWIIPTPCGPFAALDGIGAGQIAAGETRLCDHDHGGH
ncbi:hypothetical protein BH24ACT5_BH24ACT5_24060 [soil metagenome]